MKASAVIVCYRPGDWLRPCIESVLGQADEVIVVDNGSEAAQAATVARSAGALAVRVPVNQGFAHAVNIGARRARGELLALLNDDAVAGEGWLAKAAKVLEDTSVAAVGPKIVFAACYREIVLPDAPWQAPGDPRPLGRQVRSVRVQGAEVLSAATGGGLYRLEGDAQAGRWRWTAGQRPWYVPLPLGETGCEVLVDGQEAPPGPVVRLVNSAGAYLDERGYAGDIGSGAPDDGRFDTAADRFALSGAALVTRLETWEELGGFAGPFFAYYEDVDWCWRAQLAGLRLVYDPTSSVAHRGSASSGGEHEPWVRVLAERNRTLSMVRNGPLRLAGKALYERLRNGPDGGVRAGVARLLPWALLSRAKMSRNWKLEPEEVWRRWAGRDVTWPDGPAGPLAFVRS